MKPLLIISSDSHAGAHPSSYAPYIDPQYRPALQALEEEERELLAITSPLSSFSEEALNAIDGEGVIRSGGATGSWDMRRRLRELDREGVAAEIVLPGVQSATLPFFSQVNKKYPPEYRAAGAKAYHRWFTDYASESDGRVFGVGDPGPCRDLKESVAELHWLADHNWVSVGPPGIIKDVELPSLYDSYFDPFWAACEERSLVLGIHAGYGIPQGSFFDFAAKVRTDQKYAAGVKKDHIQDLIEKLKESRESPFYLDIRPRRAFWQMVMGGVFDRFPKLRLAFAEVRADWIPGTLDYLDARFDQERGLARLKPSEYFARHCYVTPSSPRPAEIALRDRLGVERIMFGVDYPHPEGTWPNTREWIREALRGVPEDEARRFLGENAIECYGLDRVYLERIAARIAPSPAELLGDTAATDAKVIDHFQARAGFLNPPEAVDVNLLDIAVGEDIAGRSMYR